MSYRAGYDVVELMWLDEDTFGQKKTGTEKWLHHGDALSIDPTVNKTHRERIGLGRQTPKSFTLLKKFVELGMEYDALHYSNTVDYEYNWANLLGLALSDAFAIDTFPQTLGKHAHSRSVGAKLDLTTDEYWTLLGVKTEEFSIGAEQDGNVHVTERAIAQSGAYNTTDYVGGTQARKNFPTTEPIAHSDCDVLVNSASIMDSLLRWSFNFRREYEKHGSKSGEQVLYNSFVEGRTTIGVDVVMDFDDLTELNAFMADTAIDVLLKIDNATNGANIQCSASAAKMGKWRTMKKPIRELDLINLNLHAEFDTVTLSKQA